MSRTNLRKQMASKHAAYTYTVLFHKEGNYSWTQHPTCKSQVPQQAEKPHQSKQAQERGIHRKQILPDCVHVPTGNLSEGKRVAQQCSKFPKRVYHIVLPDLWGTSRQEGIEPVP